MKSAAPIAFDYRPSRVLVGALVVVALAAAVAPWSSAASGAARLALSVVAIGVALTALHAYLTPDCRRIAHGAAGWQVVDGAGRERAAQLVAHRRLGSLVVLDLRVGPRRRLHIVLLPDNLDRETHRRLVLVLARGEDAAVDGVA